MSHSSVAELNHSYEAALATTKAMLSNGEIKQYSTQRDPEFGMQIHVETDQGWDPDPLYQEFHDEGQPVPFN